MHAKGNERKKSDHNIKTPPKPDKVTKTLNKIFEFQIFVLIFTWELFVPFKGLSLENQIVLKGRRKRTAPITTDD